VRLFSARWMLLPLLMAGASAQAREDLSARPVVVLDTTGFWRIHYTLKPPVIELDSGLAPLVTGLPWADRETPPATAGWTSLDFDDHRWQRNVVRLTSRSPYVERICLRGKFAVTDPAKAQDLKVSLVYHGGAVVYINGREVSRANLAKGADLAESYSPTAFLKGGALMPPLKPFADRTAKPEDPLRRLRKRELKDIPIPPDLLRPGVNVLAIEVVRSPYPRVLAEKKDPKAPGWTPLWNTCQIDWAQLTAASAEGLVPNAVRPPELQVWNQNLLASDYDVDFGDRTEKLGPIRIMGAGNGSFSGKVMVGAAHPILNLKADAGDLQGPAEAIPATRVEIRYAAPWGDDGMVEYPSPHSGRASLLGSLLDAPPEEIAVRKKEPWGARAPGQPPTVHGAVAAIWVTVNVPKDARPGLYSGEVTIEAQGEKPLAVPLELKVADWTLPAPQDRRTWVEIIQSPDTLATEYEIPLWSERHWELIAQSFKLLSHTGSRIVYVPLIAETNQGHAETMVRWIATPQRHSAGSGPSTGGGPYEYDFSLMDRYLDTAEKNLGKPKIVVFYAWDVYMIKQEGHKSGATHEERTLLESLRAKSALVGKGPMVTVSDKTSHKTANMELPGYTEPASKGLWKPLFEQLKQRMAKRGLEDAMMLGMVTDAWPTRAEVAFFAEVAPGLPWVFHTHGSGQTNTFYGKLARIGYQCKVWDAKHPMEHSLMGWKQPELLAIFNRDEDYDRCPSSMWRSMCEFAIAGEHRGVARLGAEYWKVLKNKRGERAARISARYPQSNWRNLDIYTSVLSPGPKGLGLTPRYMHLCEGIQECEARIAVERALSDEALRARLGADLAARCERALQQRLRVVQMCYSMGDHVFSRLTSLGNRCPAPHLWNVGSGWEDRTEEIYDLAGEVQRRLGPK